MLHLVDKTSCHTSSHSSIDVVGDLEEIIFATPASEEKYYFFIHILFLYLNFQFWRWSVTVPEVYLREGSAEMFPHSQPHLYKPLVNHNRQTWAQLSQALVSQPSYLPPSRLDWVAWILELWETQEHHIQLNGFREEVHTKTFTAAFACQVI